MSTVLELKDDFSNIVVIHTDSSDNSSDWTYKIMVLDKKSNDYKIMIITDHEALLLLRILKQFRRL